MKSVIPCKRALRFCARCCTLPVVLCKVTKSLNDPCWAIYWDGYHLIKILDYSSLNCGNFTKEFSLISVDVFISWLNKSLNIQTPVGQRLAAGSITLCHIFPCDWLLNKGASLVPNGTCPWFIKHRFLILTFLWPCISVYLSQYLTNLMHKICFTISFISCLYMFRAYVLIIRRSKLHYTASGIITPIGGRVMTPEAV